MKKLKYGLMCVPIVLLIGLIFRYAVDVPFWDEWEYVQIIDNLYNGGFTSYDLWRQHNEHRLIFPKIITIVNILLFNWNIYINICFIVIFSLMCAWLINEMINKTTIEENKKQWMLISVLWIIFSFNQAENWLWGFQIAFALAVFMAILSIYYLSIKERITKNIIISAIAAVVSIYSSANGLFLLPVGIFILYVQSKYTSRDKVLWIGIVGIACICYFIDFHFVEKHGGFTHNLQELINDPLNFLLALSVILSRIFTGNNPNIFFSAFISFLCLCWQILLIKEYRRLIRKIPMAYVGILGVGIYSLLCVLFIGFGRFTLGGLDSSRYIIFSLYFWISLICQTFIIFESKITIRVFAYKAVAMSAIFISLYGTYDMLSYAEDMNESREKFKQEIMSGERVDSTNFFDRIYPNKMMIENIEVLKRNGIRNFSLANSEFKPDFELMYDGEYALSDDKCYCYIDVVKMDTSKVAEIRGWGYVSGVNNIFNNYKLIVNRDDVSYITELKSEVRTDVMEAFPNEINLYNCGFSARNKFFKPEIISGDYNLFIGIETSAGKYMYPLNKTVHIP